MFEEYFPGYDPFYEFYDYRSWCGYSDSAFLFIFEKDGILYALEGGNNGFHNTPTKFDEIYVVSEEKASELLEEWDNAFGLSE